MRFLANAFLAVAAVIVFSGSAAATPIEAFARLPAMSNVDISDDGTAVAYVRLQDTQQVVVAQELGGNVLQEVSLGEDKVRGVSWAGPDHIVIVSSVTAAIPGLLTRGERYQASALNVRTGSSVQLLRRIRERQSYLNILLSSPVIGTWQGQSVAYVVGLAAGEGNYRVDLLRVDLDDGEGHLHQMGALTTEGFLVTPEGEVIAQTRYEDETSRWTLSLRQGGGWRDVHQLNVPVDVPQIGALTPDGAAVLVAARSDGPEGWQWLEFARDGGARSVSAIPVRAGLITDNRARLLAHVVTDHFSAYTFNDPAKQAVWDSIAQVFPGRQVQLTSSTPDFSKVIVYVEGTGYAGNYILYDSGARSLRQIGRAYPAIPADAISEVRAITYNAQDGLEIPAYLTLPAGREARGLPLIVLPHGGPQARDYASFDWMAQGLASRGYAVLQPNFRGSSGYGQAHVEAAYGEWGRKMQTDLSDGITYLASRQIIDPARVCIMGASYGGYAALAGVTLQDGIYRCAVSIAGVSDVAEMLRDDIRVTGRRNSGYRYWIRYLGVETVDDRRLEQVSPVRAAGNGRAPVLLIHGRDDTVVPYSQSTDIERALRDARRPVQLVELASEDHYLSREPSRIQMMREAVRFLEEHNPPRP